MLTIVDTHGRAKASNKAYRLASRDFRPESTVVRVGNSEIGGREFVVMAGPCAVESAEQVMAAAVSVSRSGAAVLRGGAFKPRTSPYDFRGLGADGLRLLAGCREATGLPIVTEVVSERDVELVAEYADMLQIGSRNMSNFTLLEEVARTGKPVLLKRGMQSSIKEWLLSAEYILAQGNDKVVLCERGIRSFDDDFTRNTLDLNALVVAKMETHLPVVVDPSHATGRTDMVIPMAKAAVAAGADGVIVEVHPSPAEALCDGKQSLSLAQFDVMMEEIAPYVAVSGRSLSSPRSAVGAACRN